MLQLRFLPVTWPTARHFGQIASILLQEKLTREDVIVCFGFRRRAIRAELPSELPSHEVHCSGLTKFQDADSSVNRCPLICRELPRSRD